jgi:2,4-dienoyl-CoA reductase-like NADH-dependent reductase (Old Yellow Enzyme family)
MPPAVRLGLRAFGRQLLRSYPYTDGYFLPDARQVRAAVTLPMVALGGMTNRQVIEQAMADGFQFVAMGRALLMEPDLVRRLAQDPATRSACTHCNKCMATIYSRGGTRCVLLDPEGRVPEA